MTQWMLEIALVDHSLSGIKSQTFKLKVVVHACVLGLHVCVALFVKRTLFKMLGHWLVLEKAAEAKRHQLEDWLQDKYECKDVVADL